MAYDSSTMGIASEIERNALSSDAIPLVQTTHASVRGVQRIPRRCGYVFDE